MIVVVMGVSGSGKTVVGQALAADLGWPFFDADDFHPEANVAKMAAGTPLTDADRWPWLDRLAAEMAAIEGRGRQRRAGVLGAAPGLSRPDQPRGRRPLRPSRRRPRHHRRAACARVSITTCRRRCSRASSRRSKRRQDAIVVDVRDAVPVQVAKIRAALKV